MANMLNSFFTESVEDLLVNNINCQLKHTSQLNIKNQTNTMFWLPITEMEIESVVKSLKGKYSAGFDEIPEFLTKRCLHYIKKPLVHIFNASLNSGVFPEKMKIAKIRPLYKKRERQEVCNYRPISILPVFSKILERLVYNRMVSSVTKYNILTEVQNGFRKNKSTETASQTFIENIQEAMDRRVGCRYSRTPTLRCNKCLSLTVKNVAEECRFAGPKKGRFAAGVFLTAARWLRAVDAGGSPYGGGETGEAGAGAGVRKRAWLSGPEKGRFSTRSVSAGSQLTVARRGVGRQRPV
jgi:hypothetical protein